MKKQLIVFCLILSISSLGIFVLGIRQAGAGPCNILKGFDGTTCVMTIALGFLSKIIEFFGSALNLALNLLKQLLNWGEFIETDIVRIGWKITRDLANMFFVLILMAIAFASILRLETYGMKALLPKLIIAALLINFSLVLSGVVVDFAQVITDFFLSQAGGDEFQANMMNATQAVKALAIRDDVSLGTGITAMGNIFIGALLTVIFLLIIFFVFAAYALFLVIRIVALWFLLILSPIVWMLWILPATRDFFGKWWANFIKWSFFAPASAFFLFLAIFSYRSLLTESIGNALRADDYSKLLPSFTEPNNLLQFLLVIGILFGGLIVAQQMGAYGAQGAIGIARGAGKSVAKWTGRRGQTLATRPVGGRVGAIGDKLRTRLGKVPILRQALRPTRAFAEKERAAMAESEKKYSGWTSDNLKSQYKAVNPRAKAAIAKILAGRGDFKADDKLGFTEEEIKKATQLTKRYEQHKNVLKARPDLAPLVGEDIEKTVSKIKPADMEKLQTEALTDEVIGAIQNQLTKTNGQWKSSHLSKMSESNPDIAVEIKQKIIDAPGRKPFRQDVEEYLNSNAGKAIFGEPKPRAEKEAPFTAA